MYQVPRYYIEEGKTTSQAVEELIFNIRNGINVEQSKDDLFCLTYPMALTEVKRYLNMGRPLEDLVSDLSIAFMKTLNNYNPEASTVSFMNYYKRAIFCTVIETRYGRYKNTRESQQLLRDFEANTGSLEYVILKDKDGADNLTLGDTIETLSNDIDNLIEDITLKELIDECLNKIFDPNRRGRGEKRNARARQAFEAWVYNLVEDNGYSQTEVAKQNGLQKSNMNNNVARYMPRFKDEYLKLKGEM